MLEEYLQIYKLSIVVIGNFNPAIIQPFWLAHKKLIREQEAQTAQVEVIHPSLVKFKLDWCEFEILPERFEVKTNSEGLFDALKDLVISIFGILKETPVRAFGFNHMLYYLMPDEKRYYEVGNKLGTLSNWKDIFKDPRMFFMEIGQNSRPDGKKGSLRVRIQPSDIPLGTPYGILVYVNDHFDLSTGENSTNLVQLLSENFPNSNKWPKETTSTLWKSLKIT